MNPICFVCSKIVAPDEHGKVRFEGVTEAPKGMAWVWGPEPVHDECRTLLHTPYDNREGYILTWQMVMSATGEN